MAYNNSDTSYNCSSSGYNPRDKFAGTVDCQTLTAALQYAALLKKNKEVFNSNSNEQ
jgi:hypothetical protein